MRRKIPGSLSCTRTKDIYGDTPSRCLDILAGVDSPALRAAWDAANFVQCGSGHIERDTRRFGPIEYVHVKDAISGSDTVVPAGEGDGQLPDPLRAASLRIRRLLFAGTTPGISGNVLGFQRPELFRKAAGAFKSYSADRASNGPDGKRASGLLALNGLDVSPNSVVRVDGAEVGLTASGQWVAVLAPSGSRVLSGFEGETSAVGGRARARPEERGQPGCLARPPTLAAPAPLGTRTSAGFGDRLGLATPGHVRAMRAAGAGLGHLRPAVHKRDGAYGQEPPGGSRRRNLGRLRRRWQVASGLTPTTSRRPEI